MELWEETLHDLVAYLKQHTTGWSVKAVAQLLLLAFAKLVEGEKASV